MFKYKRKYIRQNTYALVTNLFQWKIYDVKYLRKRLKFNFSNLNITPF